MKAAALFAFLLCGPALADLSAGKQAMKNGDDATAVREVLPLAKEGNPAAQLYLCSLYVDGAVPHDFKEAVKWCRSVAEQGQAQAQIQLGTIYEAGGDGVQADNTEAAKWYRLAAEQGNGEKEFLNKKQETGQTLSDDDETLQRNLPQRCVSDFGECV
ncbi:MAG TPA: tetratricopeptide repeat protein [Bryobacteraceae bacterium]|jgi:hypothetical protein|nr:tetratricopeptide repeat protein [Bryobacteraceae bacterium]